MKFPVASIAHRISAIYKEEEIILLRKRKLLDPKQLQEEPSVAIV